MRKISAILLIFKILKIPLVVIQMAIIAKYFGVTLDRDVWLLSLSFVTVVDTVIWGPVIETFRSKFIFLKEELGELECLKRTSSFLFYMLMLSLLISIIIYLFSDNFAKILAPTFDNYQVQYLSKIIKLCCPFLFLNQITLVLISILNSYNIFKVPEISSIISVLLNIFIIISTTESIGIYSLFFGQLLSSIILLVLIVYELRKNNISLFSKKWKIQIKGFTSFFVYAMPFFATYFFYNLNLLYEKKLVSILNIGSISILDYGSKIPLILNGIVTSVTLSIFLPIITKLYVTNQKEEFNKQVKVYFSSGLILIGFLITILIVNANDIVKIIYNSSNFSENIYDEIALITSLYAVFILFYFTYVVFGTILLSTKHRKIYVIIGVFTQIMLFLLYKFLFNDYSILTFPISNIVAYLISTLFLFYNYPFKNNIIKQTKKYFTVILISSSLVFITKYFLVIGNIYFSLILMSFITILFYCLTSFFLKLDELGLLLSYFKKNKE